MHQDDSELVMRNGLVPSVFGLADHLLGSEFSRFPVAKFDSVFENVFLAGKTFPVVLFISLLELIQSKIGPSLLQVFDRFFVGFLSFLASVVSHK